MGEFGSLESQAQPEISISTSVFMTSQHSAMDSLKLCFSATVSLPSRVVAETSSRKSSIEDDRSTINRSIDRLVKTWGITMCQRLELRLVKSNAVPPDCYSGDKCLCKLVPSCLQHDSSLVGLRHDGDGGRYGVRPGRTSIARCHFGGAACSVVIYPSPVWQPVSESRS